MGYFDHVCNVLVFCLLQILVEFKIILKNYLSQSSGATYK